MGIADSTACNDWGYTPGHPNLYGYINPYPYFDNLIGARVNSVVQSTSNQAVKTGPGDEYSQEVTTIQKGQQFVAFNTYANWYQVYLPSKYGPGSGWIQGELMPTQKYLLVNYPTTGVEGVNIQSTPSTSGTIVSFLWNNQVVTSNNYKAGDGCSKDWYQIDLDSNNLGNYDSGWVCGEYLNGNLDSDSAFWNLMLPAILNNAKQQ